MQGQVNSDARHTLSSILKTSDGEMVAGVQVASFPPGKLTSGGESSTIRALHRASWPTRAVFLEGWTQDVPVIPAGWRPPESLTGASIGNPPFSAVNWLQSMRRPMPQGKYD